MIFSGTATCQSDKEMDALLNVLKEHDIEPDIYGRRVLVEYSTNNDAKGKLVVGELMRAFESIPIHGTFVTRERR